MKKITNYKYKNNYFIRLSFQLKQKLSLSIKKNIFSFLIKKKIQKTHYIIFNFQVLSHFHY